MSNRIEITDFTAPELDVYARIPEVQLLRFYEPKPGLFIAESPKVIQRAANAGYQPVSFLVQHKDLEKEGKELLQKFPGIPVYTADYEVLVKLTGFALTRGNALCHDSPGPSLCGRYLQKCPPYRHSGKCSEPNQYRSHFSFSCRASYGCGSSHPRLL